MRMLVAIVATVAGAVAVTRRQKVCFPRSPCVESALRRVYPIMCGIALVWMVPGVAGAEDWITGDAGVEVAQIQEIPKIPAEQKATGSHRAQHHSEANKSGSRKDLDKVVAVLSRNLAIGVVSYLLNGGQPKDCFGTPDCRNKIPGMFGTNSVPVEVTVSVKFKDARHYVVTALHSQGQGRRCTFQPALENNESPKKQCEPPLTKAELAELYPGR
jgi:hypothetical protein